MRELFRGNVVSQPWYMSSWALGQCQPGFTDEETRAQRGQIIHPSHFHAAFLKFKASDFISL